VLVSTASKKEPDMALVLLATTRGGAGRAARPALTTHDLVVGVAGNGRDAVESAAPAADIVIMDIGMPELDGVEATRRIVESPALSADSFVRDAEHIHRACWLPKVMLKSPGKEVVEAIRPAWACATSATASRKP
jgi:CheY-like chemotaxis protein